MTPNEKVKTKSPDWNSLFSYSDGWLFWKRSLRGLRDGKRAGCIDKVSGYYRVCYRGKGLMGHRIIWEMHYGAIEPSLQIDHINRNPSDNRIENLRKVTAAENSQNMKTPKNNTSGFRGAYWDKINNTWYSSISVNGVVVQLGRFLSAEEAGEAYREAEKLYHVKKLETYAN